MTGGSELWVLCDTNVATNSCIIVYNYFMPSLCGKIIMKRLFLSLLTSVVTYVSAHANLTAYVGFGDSDFGVTQTSRFQGIVDTQGLSFQSLATSGGAVSDIQWYSAPPLQWSLDQGPIASGSVWISWLLQAGDYYGGISTATRGANLVYQQFTQFGNTFEIGLGSATTYIPLPSQAGEIYLYGANVNFETQTTTFYRQSMQPGASFTAFYTYDRADTISSLGLWLDPGSVMDELRIGTALSDVVPVEVPEPANTAVLTSVAILGTCIWRRQRTMRSKAGH
jgi:hypothetical protein